LEENAERINKIETQLLSEHNMVVYQSNVKIKRNMAIPILVYKSSFSLPVINWKALQGHNLIFKNNLPYQNIS
jgi:hypothetical protein